jgi:EAL domain-containing protein (putative c-di-GMP-specific phosphodiesterase class I)
MLEAFDAEYEKLRLDYKIVICESLIDLKIKNDCAALINSVHRHMDINSVHRIIQTDVDGFMRYEYILSELTDIVRGGNLRDPRVLAYCQPVYNISTGKYDTAEALMRLRLSEIGMVFPDQFIPLAEENGYIHSLTKIILQRTCDEIRYLVKENYDVKRISVNVSVLEMRDESFITDIEKIIKESEIPKDKIAIEITESQNDDDFMIMKDKVDRLKDMGIKIYLDDFGTGYSNMERIMELPFDIIKFDRSLVLASSTDNRSEKMVGSLAEMFSDLNYSVLYEGVETEDDEKRCTELSASYLQGYKYSKPIPIERLTEYFEREIA